MFLSVSLFFDPLLRRCRTSVWGSRSPGHTACVSPVLGHQVQTRWCRMRVSGGAGAPLDPQNGGLEVTAAQSVYAVRALRARRAVCSAGCMPCGPQVVPAKVAGQAVRGESVCGPGPVQLEPQPGPMFEIGALAWDLGLGDSH